MPFYFWLGLIALAGGTYLLFRAQAADRRDWIVERATPLKIGLVNPRDDVWLAGQIECATPLTVPHFGYPCVHFEFREQQQVRDRRTTRWRTVSSYDGSVDFDLVDREARITACGQDAEFDGLMKCTDQPERDRRFLASYLPFPAAAEAVGSVSDDRKRLERFSNIPLVVTGHTRLEYIARCERAESIGRGFGGFLLFFGSFCLALGISTRIGGPGPAIAAPGWHSLSHWFSNYLAAGMSELRLPEAEFSLGVAFVVFVAWLFFYLYDLLVMYRERVKTAWRQIDVDLANRHELIPELVTIIKGYAVHEREVAETLTRLRYNPETGIGLDRRESAAVGFDQLWAVAERNPELQANQLFAQLRKQLTALEEKIAFARQFYNDSLKEFDTMRGRFPTVIVARLFGRFPTYEYFSSGESDSTQA